MPSTLLDLSPERRDTILNAALKKFASKGYDNASTNVIAKGAGISKALMFHYVGSKQELFLSVYDYFSELLQKKYFELMNYNVKDIFARLRRSYVLQLTLMEQYPWILEFNRLSSPCASNEISRELEARIHKKQNDCYPGLFDDIDGSKFREGLDEYFDELKKILYI